MSPATINILVVLLCIVSGLVAKTIAKKKGRDPFVWFLVGFFLPAVGIAIAKDVKNKIQERKRG